MNLSMAIRAESGSVPRIDQQVNLLMRLDKFLKISRLVKRRTVANDLCKGGQVAINGKEAKAASEIHVGDTLQIRFGSRHLTVKVLSVPEKAVAAQAAASLYQVIADEKRDPPL